MNGTAQAPSDLSADPTGGRGPLVTDPFLPRAQGLYNPAKEHDSCGVGFVADLRNRKSHDILQKGLQILVNLDHRGATGADAKLGDGCGALVQIPPGFFAPDGARAIPVDTSDLGERVKAVEPAHRQLFIGRGPGVVDENDFERKLFILRKVVSNRVYEAGAAGFAEYYP